MAIANAPDTVSGRVEAVNPKGCKINGQWWNWSKWADEFVPPERGRLVLLLLDKSGFVRSAAPLDGAEPVDVGGGAEVTPIRRQAPGATRDVTITRLAVLKAAAEFAAARPQLKSGEVLKIAASWERWVSRADGVDLVEDDHVRE